MSAPEQTVSFQITIPKRVRNHFKGAALVADLEMYELGQIVLEWAAGVISSEAAPPALQAAIDKFKRDKAKAKKE